MRIWPCCGHDKWTVRGRVLYHPNRHLASNYALPFHQHLPRTTAKNKTNQKIDSMLRIFTIFTRSNFLFCPAFSFPPSLPPTLATVWYFSFSFIHPFFWELSCHSTGTLGFLYRFSRTVHLTPRSRSRCLSFVPTEHLFPDHHFLLAQKCVRWPSPH